jgi:hypothetical protein
MRLPRLPLHALATLALVLAMPASAGAAASASIGAVDCDAGGSIATLTHDEGAPVTFIVLRDDRAVANVVVPPGPPVTRVVPIAEGAAAQVTVRYGGSYVSGYVRRSCSATPAAADRAPAVAGAAASPVEPTPVIPGTGVRGAKPATATPAERASSDVTFTDTITTWPFLFIAGLALLAALVLGVGLVRRRPPADDATPAPAARPHA